MHGRTAGASSSRSRGAEHGEAAAARPGVHAGGRAGQSPARRYPAAVARLPRSAARRHVDARRPARHRAAIRSTACADGRAGCPVPHRRRRTARAGRGACLHGTRRRSALLHDERRGAGPRGPCARARRRADRTWSASPTARGSRSSTCGAIPRGCARGARRRRAAELALGAEHARNLERVARCAVRPLCRGYGVRDALRSARDRR